MSIFGRIITDDQVEDAVKVVLQKWMSTSLAEVERQVGLPAGHYKRPSDGSYHVRNDFDKLPEEMLPFVIVVSTGLESSPTKNGRQQFDASWAIGVAAIASSIRQDESRRYAYRLGAAIRASLVHHQSLDGALGGTVTGVRWLDGRNNELPQPEPGERSIWATRQVFAVDVKDVLTQSAGPRKPEAVPKPDPLQPYGDWPRVPDRSKITTTYTKEIK